MTTVYERSFDINEWFVIISFILLNVVILIIPKIFSRIEALAYYLYGIFIVTFFDHTTSFRPWDLYDVNDNSTYQLLDFISYIMFGAYSYFFIYLYLKLKIKGNANIFYLLIWSGFSVFLEWVGVKVGLFHYDKGYKMYWSFPVYMTVQSILIYFHLKIKKVGSSDRAI